MARNANTRAEATVTLNGQQAEQVLDKLKQQADDLRQKIKAATAATDPAKIKELEGELKQVNHTLQNVKRATYDYSQVLRNINGSSVVDLEKTWRALRAEVRKLNPQTKEFIDKSEKLRQVKSRIDELNRAGRAHASMWERLAGGFNKYFAMVTAFVATVTGLSLALRRLNEEAAKQDDVYADVRKTTDLTLAQVRELNQSFKKMDTRTAREQLNYLARDAGKLGIEGKKNILDFVDAGNQINVALGEDLGEDAIKQIGKMVGVYERSTARLGTLDLKGKMLAVGSAINELGASSTASEPYLVDFAARLGGVAKQAGISIDNILGYASALDQDMQQVEMSATAFQKFIMQLLGEPEKFARIAGLEVKAFTDLLKTDTNQAIITVLQALNEKGGFQQLIPIFKDMGLDGARAVGVLSSMAGSIDKVTAAQDVANRALQAGTSITKEYSLKNENNMAVLEKARKAFKDKAIELGEKLNPAFLKVTSASTVFIKIIGVLIDFLGRYGGAILKTALVIGTYTVAVKLHTLWTTRWHAANLAAVAVEKVKHAWLVVGTAATQLYAATTMLLAGNLKGAAQAMRIFYSVLKSNPIGLIASLVTAAALAIWTFASKTRQAADVYKVSVKDIAQAQQQHIESVIREKSEVNNLVRAITDVNTSNEVRKKLIGELKEKYPEYLKFINTEKVSNNELLVVLARINNTYRERLQVAALQGKSDAYTAKIVELEKRKIEVEERLTELGKTAISPGTALEKEWQALNEEDKKLSRKIDEYAQKTTRLADDITKTNQQIAHSFTLEGVRDELDNTAHHIETLKQRMAKAGSDDEAAWYKGEIEKLEIRKKTLEEQVKKAEDEKPQPKTDPKPLIDKDPEFDEKELKKRLQARLKALQDEWDTEKLKVMQAYEAGKKNYTQYKEALAEIDERYNIRKAEIEEEFNQSGASSLQKSLQAKIKALEQYEKAVAKVTKQTGETQKNIQKQLDKSENDFLKTAFRELKSSGNEVDKLVNDMYDDYNKERLDMFDQWMQLRYEYNMVGLDEQFDAEIATLERLKEEGIISTEEAEQAKLKIRLKYACQVAQIAGQFAQMGAGVVAAWQDYETQKLEAEYQKRLALAGDDADAREQIENEKVQKELELKKKFADFQFAVDVAQIISSTSLAIMQAYAQLGPIAGSIAAALVGATSVLQIAAAKKQRDAVKSMTLAGSGGSTSQRVVLPGKQQGGYMKVEREQDGKPFEAIFDPAKRGFIDRPTVLVGEAGSEFVANHQAVNNPTIKPVLDIIDLAQRQGTIATINLPAVLSSTVVKGKAQGGYTTKAAPEARDNRGYGNADSTTINNEQLLAVMQNVEVLLADLKNNGVKAPIVLSEWEKVQALKQRSEGLGSR